MVFPFLLFVALGQVSQQPGGATATQTPLPAAPSASASQPPVAPAPAPAVAAGFSVAPTVVETQRIELTPKIDGKIDDEEWDPFSTSGPVKTYFQWEPGVIYAAATGPAGQDMLVSL